MTSEQKIKEPKLTAEVLRNQFRLRKLSQEEFTLKLEPLQLTKTNGSARTPDDLPRPSIGSPLSHQSDTPSFGDGTPVANVANQYTGITDIFLPSVLSPGLAVSPSYALPDPPPDPVQRIISRTRSENSTFLERAPIHPFLDRSRSTGEMSLQYAVSLHFSETGTPKFLEASEMFLQSRGSLSQLEIPSPCLPSISPTLSQLPSVQLSIGGFSDVPDVSNEDIVECATMIIALFQAIAPNDTERHIATLILDFAYLCNSCGKRSQTLHHCDIHGTYECSECWVTECCNHRGSCSLCANICPKCNREVCKHCLRPGGRKCDRCCLSLPGYNSDIYNSEQSEATDRLIFLDQAGRTTRSNDTSSLNTFENEEHEDFFLKLPSVPDSTSIDPDSANFTS